MVSRLQSQLSYVLFFGTEANKSSTKELLVKPVEPGPEDCCQVRDRSGSADLGKP